MGGLLFKVKTWWETADRTQKAVTLFGSVFLVLLLAGTFYFASKPKMAMAFSGLNMQELGSVTAEIQKMGIPCDYDAQGNVQVPTDKVAEVTAKLAVSGKLPSEGHLGSDELSKINAITTPTVERERLKNILEDQLSQSIETFKGVDKARVHITFGQDSAFEVEQKPATASVVISQTPGGYLTPDQGHSIAMLVANAVQGLSSDKVVVLDSSGHPLFDASQMGDASGAATTYLKTQEEEKTRIERDLQQALDNAFGRGNTIAKVNLVLNFDKKTLDQTLHPIPEGATIEETKKETMSSDGGALTPPVVAGPQANKPASVAPSTPDGLSGKGYKGETKTLQRPEQTQNTHQEFAVGTIKEMSISTLVNKDKTQEDPVKSFIAGYIGTEAANPNFKQSVTSVSFDTTAQAAVDKADKAVAARNQMQQIFSFLPIAALIFVGFMVVRAISKVAKAKELLVPALPAGELLALEHGDLPTALETEHEHEAERQRKHEQALQKSIADIGTIQEKLNLPLEQIKRMSDEKAESVAMLIKSWLLEDH